MPFALTPASLLQQHLDQIDGSAADSLFELLFDALRRHLCLESRYLDPVEQDKARTSAPPT